MEFAKSNYKGTFRVLWCYGNSAKSPLREIYEINNCNWRLYLRRLQLELSRVIQCHDACWSLGRESEDISFVSVRNIPHHQNTVIERSINAFYNQNYFYSSQPILKHESLQQCPIHGSCDERSLWRKRGDI